MADPTLDPNAAAPAASGFDINKLVNTPLAQLLIPAAAVAATAAFPRYGGPAAMAGLGAVGAMQRAQNEGLTNKIDQMRLGELTRAEKARQDASAGFYKYVAGLSQQPVSTGPKLSGHVAGAAPAGGNAPAVGMAAAAADLEAGKVDAPHEQATLSPDDAALAKSLWDAGDHAGAANVVQKHLRHPYDFERLRTITSGVPVGGKIEANFGDESNPIKYTYENKARDPKYHFETLDNGKTKQVYRYDENNPNDKGTPLTSVSVDRSGIETTHFQIGDNGTVHAFIVHKNGAVTHMDTGVKAKDATAGKLYENLGNKLIMAQQGRPTGDPEFDAQYAGPKGQAAAQAMLENMGRFLMNAGGAGMEPGSPAPVVPGQ